MDVGAGTTAGAGTLTAGAGGEFASTRVGWSNAGYDCD